MDKAFGGGAGGTLIHPVVAVILAISILLLFFLPQKYRIAPLLFCIFLVPQGQQFYAAGVHWYVGRVVILAGLFSLSASKGKGGKTSLAGGFNFVDRAFFIVILCEALGTTLRNMSTAALLNQFGFLIDYMGGYYLIRRLIKDEEDVHTAIKCLAFIAAIQGLAMVREQLTGNNIFGLMGGVRATPEFRTGHFRSNGVFQHTLTAGTVGGTMIPFFILLWKRAKVVWIALTGLAGASLMVFTSHSSTPLLAYAFAILGVALWPIRRNMRMVRWGIILVLVILNFTMNAPVWFVIAHVDLTGGSSGYHRAELIDQFFRHFSEWWVMGTDDTDSWGFDMWDAQNQYVQTGDQGGLVAVVFFIAMISHCYKRIGVARKRAESLSGQWAIWFLGAALLANCAGFFGVNYFDQSRVIWFVLLAIICAMTSRAWNGPVSEARQPLVQWSPTPRPAPIGVRV